MDACSTVHCQILYLVAGYFHEAKISLNLVFCTQTKFAIKVQLDTVEIQLVTTRSNLIKYIAREIRKILNLAYYKICHGTCTNYVLTQQGGVFLI